MRKPRKRCSRRLRVVAELIEELIEGYGLTRAMQIHRIWHDWPACVGLAAARHSWPQRLDQGVLRVGVSSSAWMQELSFRRDDIARASNEQAGAALVVDVRFCLAVRSADDRGDLAHWLELSAAR